MNRECPRHFVSLVPEKRKVFASSVTVDVCPQCNGEFLDRGEIRKLTGDRDLDKLLTKYLGIDSDSKLVCPSCGGLMDMEQLDLGADKVEVDVCLTCKGVWLDDKELAKIKESDADFSKLSPEKLAEIFDAQQMEKRNKALGGMFRGLRRRR